MPEDQGKIPNKEKNLRASEKFNEEFTKHITRIGWTDPELQKRFVALINSYILSGDNASSQRVIVNYLDKGLDVLNIELKRIEITKGNNVVQVSPDDVGGDERAPEQQVETVTSAELNKMISEGRRKRLSTVNVLKEELSENKKRNQIVRKLLSKSEATEEELEELVEETINALLEQRIIKEQGDVNSNNFRVFFANYLDDEKSWNTETSDKLITAILDVVEKGAGNITGQKQAVRETDNLLDRLSKVVEIKQAPQTKNSQIAFNELATFASKLRGWSSEFFSEFISNLLKIVGSSKSQKSQRYIVDKFSAITNSMKGKEKDKDEPKKDSDNEKKTSKPDAKNKKGKSAKKSSGEKEIKKELDYSYKSPDYESPEDKAHRKLNDKYGVEIDKALDKLLELKKIPLEELPDDETFDRWLNTMENKFDKDLVETIFSVIADKPDNFGDYEMNNLIIEHIMDSGNDITDVFDVVNHFYEFIK